MEIIARVRNDFPAKFGLPRQSALGEKLVSVIVFEKEYRVPEALRGLEEYSHLWLLWGFHAMEKAAWSPTVRPPRLGGNTRMGVFATRSPNRPNPIGLSCVRLLEIRKTEDQGTVLVVSGTDMMDGTPVYDIKPYLAYTDSHPEALGGFAGRHLNDALSVECDPALIEKVPPEKREALLALLSQDPRPAYQNDPERVYGFFFGDREIRFTVKDEVLRVVSITLRA